MASWRLLYGSILLAGLASMLVNVQVGNDGELFPMTAYPMYSKGVPLNATRFAIEILDGARPIGALPAAQAFSAKSDVSLGAVDSVVGALVADARARCATAGDGIPRCGGNRPEPLLAWAQETWTTVVPERLGHSQFDGFRVVREEMPPRLGGDWSDAVRTPLFELSMGARSE